MSDQAIVQTSRIGAVGVIELAHPKALNALSNAAFRAIEQALNTFEADQSGVRVILVRAQGKHFCTGADLTEAKTLRSDSKKIGDFIAYGHQVLRRLENSELPVVAACQGLALAGGGELMLACDVVFASSDFRFGDQHAQYGLVPGFGGSQRLTRIVGLRRSLDLFFSASWIDAPTALQWGLVNHIVDPEKLNEATIEYCTKLATRSKSGISAMKHLARQGLEMQLTDGLKLEEVVASKAMISDDVSEGLKAFEERRAPIFKI